MLKDDTCRLSVAPNKCFNYWAGHSLNGLNFRYLANDVEEDEEEIKYEIFPWALGKKWKKKYPGFLAKRDKLLKRIDYRAIVSKRCCEEVTGTKCMWKLIEFQLWKSKIAMTWRVTCCLRNIIHWNSV